MSPFRIIFTWIAISVILGMLSSALAQYPPAQTVLDIAWNADGTAIAYAYQNGTIAVYNPNQPSTTPLFTFSNGQTPAATVAWHPSNPSILAAGIDASILIWDISTGQLLATLLATPFDTEMTLESPEMTEQIRQIDWNITGTQFASLTDAGVIRIWEYPNFQQTTNIADTIQIGAISWIPSGGQIAIGRNLWILFLNTANGVLSSIDTDNPKSSVITTIDWSGDGSKIAIGSILGEAYTFDATTLTRLTNTSINPALDEVLPIRSIMWHLDSRYYAGAASDGYVRIWDSQTGQQVALFGNGNSPIHAVAFSPDGSKLAYGGENGIVEIVEVGSLLNLATPSAP